MPEVHYFYEPSLSRRANYLFRIYDIKTEWQAVAELPAKLKADKHYNIGKKTIAEMKAWLDARTPHPLRLTFAINHPGEAAAGISSYTDTVTVEVESGDPGGEEGKFAEFMLTGLEEWYDGAKVELDGGKV